MFKFFILCCHIDKVTIIVRKQLYPDDHEFKHKLDQKIIESDKFEDALKNEEYFKDKWATFCAIGTTRGKAGSAEQFVKVDLGIDTITN